MSPLVLLLADSIPGPQAELRRVVELHAICELRQWRDLNCETLRTSAFRLIIANVATESIEEATAFFEWLLRNPLPVSILAVLPDKANPEFLRTVADVTDDFLFLPIREEEFNLRLQKILASRSCADTLEIEMGLTNLVGKDPNFLKAIEQVKLFAGSNTAVLITGETGT
ncbi:MAG TPA: hypothetical protein VLK33_11915, partial [Terriglobales bacterium]|nr:hypothetical protein [Terriglobales bacterium]